jgi:hypothetical protein
LLSLSTVQGYYQGDLSGQREQIQAYLSDPAASGIAFDLSARRILSAINSNFINE